MLYNIKKILFEVVSKNHFFFKKRCFPKNPHCAHFYPIVLKRKIITDSVVITRYLFVPSSELTNKNCRYKHAVSIGRLTRSLKITNSFP